MSGLQTWKIRRLEPCEHGRTRKLWEEVFVEDTGEFLDYYYSYKIADNEIYVIEIDDEIVSMLHLNPYVMRIRQRLEPVHYIVAVATSKEYRSQGMMRTLLTKAMEDMKQRHEPFTFLMPADEAIYAPYGFEYIYEQRTCELVGKKLPDEDVIFTEMAESDAGDVSSYMNQMLDRYIMTTWRDESYCIRMLAEQKSENGGILIARKNNQIIGVFPWAKEEAYEIREPMFTDEDVLYAAACKVAGNAKAKVSGYGNQRKPLIMAKVLDETAFFECFGETDFKQEPNYFINEVV